MGTGQCWLESGVRTLFPLARHERARPDHSEYPMADKSGATDEASAGGVAAYARDGLLVLEDVLSAAEVAGLLATAQAAFEEVRRSGA